MRAESSPFPWRPLTALLLALAAQTLLEPPARPLVAIVLYALAIVFIVWSFLRNEWTLPPPNSYPPTSTSQPPITTYQLLPLLASLLLLGAAFYFFGDNQFTILNLSLWLAGIAFFIRAFWQDTDTSLRAKRHRTRRVSNLYAPEEIAHLPWRAVPGSAEEHRLAMTDSQKESAFFRVTPALHHTYPGGRCQGTQCGASVREIRVQNWFFFFTIILLIAAFFRFYNLVQIPAEPFSDHAEKLFDVYDITQGETRIFFPRNTGREAIQFYWSLLVAAIFQTGLSFQTLKIGTAILGFLTLPFIYLLGKEIANRRAGLLAMLFAGIAYWPNVISRVGLRFPLYPLFVAPTLFFLLRGLRTRNRNDLILSGLFLGLGMHGYTPFRIVPVLVVVTLILWWLYARKQVDRYTRTQVGKNSALLLFVAFIVFLPLLRYSIAHPDEFWFRASSRAVVENPVPIFFSNLWNALLMFNVDDGTIFVNSIVHRPALDVVTGALFLLGLTLLLARRNFLDLALLAAILTLILPSALSLAYPDENPALNRAAGALAPVFVLAGMTLDGLLTGLGSGLNRSGERVIVAGVVGILFAASAIQNYDLVFRQYDEQYQRVVWRTSEMGAVIKEFGDADRAWVVPYEQWVDTRLPALWAGFPNRDLGLPRGELASTLQLPPPKLFLFKASPLAADFDDAAALDVLRQLYPQGQLTLHESEPWWQSFWVYFVPAR